MSCCKKEGKSRVNENKGEGRWKEDSSGLLVSPVMIRN